MSNLIARVRAHTTGQKTSGQATTKLLVECLEHMFGESGDWSPLAYLIGKSEPAQSRIVRRLTGSVIHGYTLKADDTQPSGLRFVKRPNSNQGIDLARLDTLRDMVALGKSIQSKDVADLWKPVAAEVTTDEMLRQSAERFVAKMVKEGVAVTAAIAAIQVAAKAAEQKAKIKRLEEGTPSTVVPSLVA